VYVCSSPDASIAVVVQMGDPEHGIAFEEYEAISEKLHRCFGGDQAWWNYIAALLLDASKAHTAAEQVVAPADSQGLLSGTEAMSAAAKASKALDPFVHAEAAREVAHKARAALEVAAQPVAGLSSDPAHSAVPRVQPVGHYRNGDPDDYDDDDGGDGDGDADGLGSSSILDGYSEGLPLLMARSAAGLALFP
jgi:hypothetical protein